jgi:hypothetical protein
MEIAIATERVLGYNGLSKNKSKKMGQPTNTYMLYEAEHSSLTSDEDDDCDPHPSTCGGSRISVFTADPTVL